MPQKIIDILLALDNAEFGLLYRLLDNYIKSDTLPDNNELTVGQQVIFNLCKAIIDPILKQRERAKEAREARKITITAPTSKPTVDRPNVPAEHIQLMKRAINRINRVVADPIGRDKKVREKLKQYFPNVYRDIIYSADGSQVTLVV